MKKIFKYEIKITYPTFTKMPKESKILSFQEMNGKYFIWVLVDTDKTTEKRIFYIFGTGHLIENIENLNYIGTAHDNTFVWHLFEKLNNLEEINE